MSTGSQGLDRRSLSWWILVIAMVTAGGTFGSQMASASGGLVQVSKSSGVKRVGDLRIRSGQNPTKLQNAINVFGVPASTQCPYNKFCRAYFGSGLRLDYMPYGYLGSYERYLVGGRIKSRHWRVRVGTRLYRVGMPKRRIPASAKPSRFGYRLASIKSCFPSLKLGSVYAQLGGRGKIRAFLLGFKDPCIGE